MLIDPRLYVSRCLYIGFVWRKIGSDMQDFLSPYIRIVDRDIF